MASRPVPTKVWCGYRRKGLAERLTDAQSYTTTGIISTEQPQTNSHDSTSTSSDDDLKTYVISKGTSNKKKGFRGWWREVFGRMAS
jgi:phage gp46-like protein